MVLQYSLLLALRVNSDPKSVSTTTFFSPKQSNSLKALTSLIHAPAILLYPQDFNTIAKDNPDDEHTVNELKLAM